MLRRANQSLSATEPVSIRQQSLQARERFSKGGSQLVGAATVELLGTCQLHLRRRKRRHGAPELVASTADAYCAAGQRLVRTPNDLQPFNEREGRRPFKAVVRHVNKRGIPAAS